MSYLISGATGQVGSLVVHRLSGPGRATRQRAAPRPGQCRGGQVCGRSIKPKSGVTAQRTFKARLTD